MRWAENEPVLDGGNPPRPFRHLRVTEHRTPDLSSSQVPVHSVLVQKSVTTPPTPQAGFQDWMLGKPAKFRKPHPVKSWQRACKRLSALGIPLCALCGGSPGPLRFKIWKPMVPQKRKSRLEAALCVFQKKSYLAFTMACSSSNTSSSALANRCVLCTIAEDPTWLFRFNK